MSTNYIDIISQDQHIILYRPEFNQITGSVTASILLQQIIYRYTRNDRQPFYKFKEPCNHKLYTNGDSWTEELGFTKKEFDGAIKKIGFKRTSKTQNVENTTKPIEYWTDLNRVTYYKINEDVLEPMLKKIYEEPYQQRGSSKIPKGDLGKQQKGIYFNITETTNKKTTTTENSKGDDSKKASSSSIFFDSIKPILPPDKQTPAIINMLEKKLNKGHSELSLYDAIAYSLKHAKTDFLGYLGKCIDQQYAPDGYHQEQYQNKESKEQELYNKRKQLPDDLLKQYSEQGDKIAAKILKERYHDKANNNT